MTLETPNRRHVARREDGFTLVELLVSTGIMLIVMAGTMTAMRAALNANELASMTTSMNANLRAGMDLMTFDLLQTGQNLPVGRVIQIPSGAASEPIRLPGAPGSSPAIYTVPVGTTELSAVFPRPGSGPTINGVATDVITVLASDSSVSNLNISAITNTSITVALPGAGINGLDISNNAQTDIKAANLIMLTKGSLSVLVQVTSVNGVQTVNFAAGDSLKLNQTAAAAGTLTKLNAAAPANSTVGVLASRIRMITYYLDSTTTPGRPRLVRRLNNGHATTFNNTLGTAVALDAESLQITYDLSNGTNNPTNVKFVAADYLTTGKCSPNVCSRNQVRKVNVVLGGRSRHTMSNDGQPLRNRLSSQISLRGLAFVDRYTSS